MRVLNDSDYKLFEQLVSLNQKSLRNTMIHFLKSKYENCICTKKFVVAVGDTPIALVAHLDTVFQTPVSNLYYDKEKGVLWSPEGLGADDRAGVFAIIKIIQAGYRPSIILTTDEERGGIGARALSSLPCPIPNLKYMIELDRRGKNDCVFYDCYCPDFIHYIESFGFFEQYGSFSDISFLMEPWDICGVNLSIGYEDEHSYSETFHIEDFFNTIEKVKKMLEATDIPDFKYENIVNSIAAKDMIFGQHCSKCKELYSEFELFPVKGVDGKTKHYCPNCIGHVGWCDICQEAYELSDPNIKNICKECAEDICMKTSKSSSEK